jgi:septal ring factor EnvC (AmiA/AmiB activator)
MTTRYHADMTDSELRDCIREIDAERSKTQARIREIKSEMLEVDAQIRKNKDEILDIEAAIREIAARRDGEEETHRTASDKNVH